MNFPYKRHISSKIRRDLAKTRLILDEMCSYTESSHLIFSRINGPNIFPFFPEFNVFSKENFNFSFKYWTLQKMFILVLYIWSCVANHASKAGKFDPGDDGILRYNEGDGGKNVA